MVANDMHLGLNIPNIWYRLRLTVEGSGPNDPPELDLAGVTLPGTPLLVAGSNTSIAWGFTNSRGDWSDLVLIETDPRNADNYLTPDGYVPLTSTRKSSRSRARNRKRSRFAGHVGDPWSGRTIGVV